MSPDLRYLTHEETRFIKAYSVALKKNFGEFCSALQLMRIEVGVKCPMRAAKLAHQLQEFQTAFDDELLSFASKHKPHMRALPPIPSVDDLVKLIQISFFAVSESGEKSESHKNYGWYSGHPLSWEETWKQNHAAAVFSNNADNPVTAIMSAFMNLLNDVMGKAKNIKKLPPYTSDTHEDYEAYDDDDDDDDDNDPDYYDED